jgi:hypothetical protein
LANGICFKISLLNLTPGEETISEQEWGQIRFQIGSDNAWGPSGKVV